MARRKTGPRAKTVKQMARRAARAHLRKRSK